MTPKEAFDYAGLRGMQLLKPDSAYFIDSKKEFEFIFQARAALQKLLPMKPKTVTISKVFNEPIQVDVCPACGCDNILKFCQNCGQAIDLKEVT